MKAVIQRAVDASITVEGKVVGAIDHGMLVYFGVEDTDTEDMIEPFLEKMTKLRIFEDENGKMNLSLDKVGGSILFISQFTLAGELMRGNRPGFDHAMEPVTAEKFYQKGASYLKSLGYNTEMGVFGADMKVRYMNDGPVTFILDSRDFKIFQKKN